jgi:hypothetical protein
MKRLKQFDEEIQRLKKLVADLSLDKSMLRDVIRCRNETAPEIDGPTLIRMALHRMHSRCCERVDFAQWRRGGWRSPL